MDDGEAMLLIEDRSAEPWGADAWEAWLANNRALLDAGFGIGTRIMIDGRIEEYARKDGVEFDRSPKWATD